MIKGLFVISLVFLAACSPKEEQGFDFKASTNNGLLCQNDDTVTSKAIYGDDNRLDWFESPGRTKDYWAQATVALMPSGSFRFEDDEAIINATSYKNTAGLCDGEPFAEQPSAAFCSGFLVSEDLVVTAGHCIDDMTRCRRTNFVFDFAKTEPNQTEYRVPSSSIYNCQEIVARQVGSDDYAVIRLDRPVTDRTPLNLRRAGVLTPGEQVMLIGHPMGLPSKIADGGLVLGVGQKIVASVDAFASNSGSVILNSESGLVEGILVAGEPDFVWQNGCRREAVCGANCAGELITPVSRWIQHIPNIYYPNPVCDQ